MNPLLQACIDGNIKKVKELATASEIVNTADKESGQYPIFMAALYGHKKIFKHLLKMGGILSVSILEGTDDISHIRFNYVDACAAMLGGDHDYALKKFNQLIHYIEPLREKPDLFLKLLTSIHEYISYIFKESSYSSKEVVDELERALTHSNLINKKVTADYVYASRIHLKQADIYIAQWERNTAENYLNLAIQKLTQADRVTPELINRAFKTYSLWSQIYLANSFGTNFCDFASACFETSDIATPALFGQLFGELAYPPNKPTMARFYYPMTQLMSFLLKIHTSEFFPQNPMKSYLGIQQNRDRFKSALSKLQGLSDIKLEELTAQAPATTLTIMNEIRMMKSRLEQLKLEATQSGINHTRRLPESFFAPGQQKKGTKRAAQQQPEPTPEKKYAKHEQ